MRPNAGEGSMDRRYFILGALAGLGACAGGGDIARGPDGRPLARLYRIRPGMADRVSFRMLDGVNSIRAAAGLTPVAFSSELNAAAATHARDMAIQNRPWHFGSDGSSPLDRAARVGYTGLLLGENISETYETELETLAAWMQVPETRALIVAERAQDLGFAWYQEDNGKIWWTLNLGTRTVAAPALSANAAVNTLEAATYSVSDLT
ncbi:MAG: CAP domain-containing protein [Pseudomonadota bacterium]